MITVYQVFRVILWLYFYGSVFPEFTYEQQFTQVSSLRIFDYHARTNLKPLQAGYWIILERCQNKSNKFVPLTSESGRWQILYFVFLLSHDLSMTRVSTNGGLAIKIIYFSAFVTIASEIVALNTVIGTFKITIIFLCNIPSIQLQVQRYDSERKFSLFLWNDSGRTIGSHYCLEFCHNNQI